MYAVGSNRPPEGDGERVRGAAAAESPPRHGRARSTELDRDPGRDPDGVEDFDPGVGEGPRCRGAG